MKKILISHRGGKPYRLNGGEYMKSSFEIMPLEEAKDTELSFKGRFASVIITKGEEIISTNVGDYKIKERDLYTSCFNNERKCIASVVRPTLLYIWRSSPKYAPPERSRRKSLDFGCDFPGSL